MSKANKAPGSTVTSESKVEILKKSDSPKTVKETIKLVLNLFFNLFS